MQWLIDIVKEWIESQGYLTTGFINRGDPADHDFTLTDFTTNGNWHELDLSGIVPENAKAVALALRIRAEEISKTAQFRRKDQAFNLNISRFDNQVSYVFFSGDITVAVDTDRKIEYAFSDITWDRIYLTVKGWWL